MGISFSAHISNKSSAITGKSKLASVAMYGEEYFIGNICELVITCPLFREHCKIKASRFFNFLLQPQVIMTSKQILAFDIKTIYHSLGKASGVHILDRGKSMKRAVKNILMAILILISEALATVGSFFLGMKLDVVMFDITKRQAAERGEVINGHAGPSLAFFIPFCLIAVFLVIDIILIIRAYIRSK